MSKHLLESTQKTYFELLNQQALHLENIDYTKLESHKVLLTTIAQLGNSGVSVFDMYKSTHVFYSPNFGSLLGYNISELAHDNTTFLDQKIHPEDLLCLTQNGITILKLFYEFSAEEKLNYKLINEFRILNSDNQYVRVIEQHQALELDALGNLWLSLSLIDISPNQEQKDTFKSQLFNFKTGKIIPFQTDLSSTQNLTIALSKREIQILKLVKEGLLSKEISNTLDISLHTVNTHRQRILEKLGANNSLEAIQFASSYGLL